MLHKWIKYDSYNLIGETEMWSTSTAETSLESPSKHAIVWPGCVIERMVYPKFEIPVFIYLLSCCSKPNDFLCWNTKGEVLKNFRVPYNLSECCPENWKKSIIKVVYTTCACIPRLGYSFVWGIFMYSNLFYLEYGHHSLSTLEKDSLNILLHTTPFVFHG